MRHAEPADDAALRASIGTVLAHPDRNGKRGSFKGAAGRGNLLLLEHFDRQQKEWQIAGFVEFNMRVDDTLTIRDLGNAGETPQVGVVRSLLDELFRSFKPDAAQVKIRADAGAWLDIFRGIPGFELDGQEYRRPHYWAVWRWEPGRARAASQQQPRRSPPQPGGRPAAPRPPIPVQGGERGQWTPAPGAPRPGAFPGQDRRTSGGADSRPPTPGRGRPAGRPLEPRRRPGDPTSDPRR
jgi:hypothetical protein